MTGEPKNSVPQPATVSGAPSTSRLSSPDGGQGDAREQDVTGHVDQSGVEGAGVGVVGVDLDPIDGERLALREVVDVGAADIDLISPGLVPSRQWAAVSTQRAPMTDPPQKWPSVPFWPLLWIDAMNGNSPSLACEPPTIASARGGEGAVADDQRGGGETGGPGEG